MHVERWSEKKSRLTTKTLNKDHYEDPHQHKMVHLTKFCWHFLNQLALLNTAYLKYQVSCEHKNVSLSKQNIKTDILGEKREFKRKKNQDNESRYIHSDKHFKIIVTATFLLMWTLVKL
jgi:hypothetical protein